MACLWVNLVAIIAAIHHVRVGAASRDSRIRSLTLPSARTMRPASQAAGKVDVVYFGESLCPDCRRFMDETVAPLFKNGIANLMNLRFVPYGNAHISIFGCIVRTYPVQDIWFPFIQCVEAAPTLLMKAALKTCLKETEAPIDLEEVNRCAYGEEGRKLQLEFAEETDSLQPPHTSVPWVTVNGISLGGHVESLGQFICAAYQGDRPEACYEESNTLRIY